MKKENILLYSIRGGAALLVIFIHCSFPGIVGDYIKAQARAAVPIFLVISGYYSFDKDRNNQIQRVKISLIKTSKLTISVLLLYAIVNTINAIILGNQPIEWLVSQLTIKNIIGLIIFNHSVFITAIMWYLLALIYVYIIMYIAVMKNLEFSLICIIPILLLLNVFGGEFIKWPWYVSGNFFLTSLPFFLMGYWINRYQVVEKVRTEFVWTVTILGLILVTLEFVLFGDVYVYLGTILLSFGLFVLSFKYKLSEYNILAYVGKDLSTYIFTLHGVIISIIDLQMQNSSFATLWLRPILVVNVSICLSWMLWKIKKCITNIRVSVN